MKYSCFLATLFLCQISWSQSLYGSVSGGYQRIIQSSQPAASIVNSYHIISDPWFWREEDIKFTDAMNVDLSFGHLLNKHVGYELTGSYLKPFDANDNDEHVSRKLSGQFFKLSAKIILTVPVKKVNLYSKLGLNFATGKMYYCQVFNNNGAWPLGFEESISKYEYTNGASVGYNLALGTSINVSRRMSVFAEIYAIYQSFEPSKGRMTKLTYNGIDQMSYAHDPYFSQIEFGEESEAYYYTGEDKSHPQKLYKRNYSLGGFGLTVGVKFILWEKQSEESNVP